jgi:5'-3' exonuclease
MRYILIDTANMFFRGRHSAHRASDSWTKLGFALHVTLMAANKVARRFEADHVVFALEGRSWRKDFYKPYKANRAVARGAMTEEQAEEDKLFWETFDNLTKYLAEKTNCSVIRCENAEGDDIIARWIALHPQDEHVIISSDTDFVQLLAPNVKQYNGITDELHTIEGIFDAKGKSVIDKKTKEPKTIPDPQWLLFEKCMRGDSSDMCSRLTPESARRALKTRLVYRKRLRTERNKDLTGII